MKNKKSQGLSLSVIIIAILSLTVLVVLTMIFTGYAGDWSRSFAGTCQEQGGICSEKGECFNEDFPRKAFAKGCSYYERDSSTGEYQFSDEKDSGQCCLPLP